MSDDRRGARELARLYGVQESYETSFGKRVQAGIDSIDRACSGRWGRRSRRSATRPSALQARKEELAGARSSP